MKKIVITLITLLLIAVASAIFYLSGKVYTIEITEAQLIERLEEKLPMKERHLLIFDVTLKRPTVNLIDGSDRINAGIDVILNITVNDKPVSLAGSIDASGGVRYSAEHGEFFITSPAIEQLNIQGIPTKYLKQVRTLLSKTLTDYYSNHPIYTLQTADLKQVATKLILKDVIVKDSKLLIKIGL